MFCVPAYVAGTCCGLVPPLPKLQPENGTPLDAGEVGAYGRTYGATHHNGRVYVATTEFFGMRNTRVPSIYYAIINPSSGLCKAHIHKHGMVASKDGFALAFPVIAARDDGAVLGYSYGSAGSIELNGVTNPAYAGKQYHLRHKIMTNQGTVRHAGSANLCVAWASIVGWAKKPKSNHRWHFPPAQGHACKAANRATYLTGWAGLTTGLATTVCCKDNILTYQGLPLPY
jgi:hypothetical protein